MVFVCVFVVCRVLSFFLLLLFCWFGFVVFWLLVGCVFVWLYLVVVFLPALHPRGACASGVGMGGD